MKEKPDQSLGGKVKESVNRIRQDSALVEQDGVRINDALWYHLSKEYPDEIGIHVFAADIGKGLDEAKAALSLFRSGLDELARQLETDPKLAHISQIAGWSKLIYDNPRLMEKMGFEVAERHDDKQRSLAIISREKFLTRPWLRKRNAASTQGQEDSE